MDHIKVLKRAWEITWRYRTLWVFGILIAFLTVGGGGGGSGPTTSGRGGNGEGMPGGGFQMPEIPDYVVQWLIVLGVGLACLVVIFVILGTIARYVSETALIKLVDEHEETGARHSVWEGFRIGWSRIAFRLFLIGSVIVFPLVVFFTLLVGFSVGVVLFSVVVLVERVVVLGVIGIVAGAGVFFISVLLIIVASAVTSTLIRFFWRACALEDLGVVEAIREGFQVVVRRLGDVIIMALIIFGLKIAWSVGVFAASIILIPVILLVVALALLLGGIPALIVGLVSSLFFPNAILPVIFAILVGLPIFALVVGAPWLYLGGLKETYISTAWTLTYRELRALEELELAEQPLLEDQAPDADREPGDDASSEEVDGM
jgi:hypothetical protein